MNEKIIFQIIQYILDKSNSVEFRMHAVIRMRERNISTTDVFEILRNPNYIKKESESSEYSGKYNYRVMGKNDWSVVISVYYPDNLIVVTVIN